MSFDRLGLAAATEVTNTMNCSTHSPPPPAAYPTPRLVVAVLLAALILASCGKAKSPWARKMSVADRIAWMVACGIPEADVRPYDGKADYAYTSYDKRITRDTDPTSVACSLSWNRTKDRLWYVAVGLGGRGGYQADLEGRDAALPETITEPYIALVLREVPTQYHVAIRDLARGPRRRGVKVGPFEVDAGHGPPAMYWYLEVRSK